MAPANPASAWTQRLPRVDQPVVDPAFDRAKLHAPEEPAIAFRFTSEPNQDGLTSWDVSKPATEILRPLYPGPDRPETVGSRSSIVIDPGWAAAHDRNWHWQVMPDGLIYRSYLAGVKESRFTCALIRERDWGWIWDATLGGRVGLFRYGTADSRQPEGWQLDIEGAAFPRLDFEHRRNVISTDFRVGTPLTYGTKRFRFKFSYYHLCAHLGDEYLLSYPGTRRINYVRDSLVWGTSFYWTPDLRLYAEAAWSFITLGGAEPWEFQFGVDFSPAQPNGFSGSPFFAINGHLREEVDFGGNLSVQTGWQWRGYSGHLLRLGMQYFNGMSDSFEFFDRHEEKIGMGLWYDY